MADHSELVAQFCAITGAPAYIGTNYLEAHDYDLERAVDFYLEHPPQDHPPIEAEDEAAAVAQPAVQQREAFEQGVAEIPDDDDAEVGLPELARQRQRALAPRQQSQQQTEGIIGEAHDMLRRAGIHFPHHMLGVQGLGVSAAPVAGSAGDADVFRPGAADIMDVEDDEAAALAAPESASTSYHHLQQQQMLAHYQQLAQQRQAQQDAAEDPEAAEAMAAARAAEEADVAAADVGGAALDTATAAADIPLDLPEGINLEEARMLEAAMLGVPYQGRVPDFSTAAAQVTAPPSPGARDRRNLQAEQDAAYEESLAVDRAKQESIAAAQAAEEARQQAEKEAAKAAARAEDEAKQNLAALLSAKQRRLTAEPDSGEGGSVSIVVRMPDGSRKGRRFRRSDPLQAIFDFVDVQCGQAGAGCVDGGIKPGSYRLVTQFPRQVYIEGTGGTLMEAGISSDTALFLELQ